MSATSEKPEDLLRKAAIALKRKEKEALDEQLRSLKDKKAELLGQAQERRDKVGGLVSKIEAAGAKLS